MVACGFAPSDRGRRGAAALVFVGLLGCSEKGSDLGGSLGPTLGDPGCLDTSFDPRNCGACGHLCAGGECLNGACVALPPGVLATGQGRPSAIAIDDHAVYWADQQPPSILKCEKTGCGNAPTVLARGDWPPLRHLVVLAGDLFWGGASVLYKCSTAGCGGRPTAFPIDGLVQDVAVDADGGLILGVGYEGVIAPQTGLARCSSIQCDGGVPVEWMTPSEVAATGSLVGVAVDGRGNLYGLASVDESDFLVFKCALDDCLATSSTLAQLSAGATPVLTTDPNALYLGLSEPGVVGSIVDVFPNKADGQAPGGMLIVGLVTPSALAVDESTLYVADRGQPNAAGVLPAGAGYVGKCKLTGCDEATTIVQDFVSDPEGLAVDDANVYWTEQGTGGDGGISLTGRVVLHPK